VNEISEHVFPFQGRSNQSSDLKKQKDNCDKNRSDVSKVKDGGRGRFEILFFRTLLSESRRSSSTRRKEEEVREVVNLPEVRLRRRQKVTLLVHFFRILLTSEKVTFLFTNDV